MTPTRWTPRDAGGEATIATWNDEPEDEEEEENETAAAAESSSSSDDDDAGMRVAALPADGDPDFDSGPPMDGLEYLRRVRHEAKQGPGRDGVVLDAAGVAVAVVDVDVGVGVARSKARTRGGVRVA